MTCHNNTDTAMTKTTKRTRYIVTKLIRTGCSLPLSGNPVLLQETPIGVFSSLRRARACIREKMKETKEALLSRVPSGDTETGLLGSGSWIGVPSLCTFEYRYRPFDEDTVPELDSQVSGLLIDTIIDRKRNKDNKD